MLAIRVRFKTSGKRYFFAAGSFNLKDKDAVIVNTIRGLELGYCVGDIFDLDEYKLKAELKEIVRFASKDDIKNYEKNKSEESKIRQKTKELAKICNLDIKVLDADYTLDRTKLIIQFQADGRIDFRELVKKLAEEYHTRIELRQVGPRDGAKIFGGLGPCGLIVCCQTFITEFANVTIKMAKNQSLSLNPTKISGVCGKLLCCINYENDFYTELRKGTPDIGDVIETDNGDAKVLSCDVLNGNLKVKYFDEENSFGFLKFEDIRGIKIKSREKPKTTVEEIDDNADSLE